MTSEFNPKTVLHIAMLPPSFNEYSLFKFFSQFGPVLRVKVARSPKTLRSCGYGYVEFDDEVVAEQARVAINGYLVENSMLKVTQLEKGDAGLLRPVRYNHCKENFNKKVNERLTEEGRVALIEKLNKVRDGAIEKLKAKGIVIEVEPVILM